MDGSSDQLFTRAVLAHDQHATIRGRDARNQSIEALHSWAAADKRLFLADVRLQPSVDLLQLRVAQGVLDGEHQHPGDPEDVGALCAMLCSRYASYLVGQSLVIDGGLINGMF